MTTLSLAAISFSATAAPRVAPVSDLPAVKSLQANIPGRTLRASDGDAYQWPGLYFETRFSGTRAYFRLGAGEVILRVLVDGAQVSTLAKPAPGAYEIADLAPRPHTVRIEILTESQAGPNVFGGFLYPDRTKPLPAIARSRQIEFIGDSHTVGYGNTSATRECTSEEVWKTTDNSQAFGPRIARHYDADYQVNAISGRGVVRNYGGSPGDPLPQAYAYALLDHSAVVPGRDWHPQVIVIALGTNDFSTALTPQEKWKSRDELHADYESTYAAFLTSLRTRHPQAFMVVWATDMAEGEIESEAGKVVAQLASKGDDRIRFVPIHGLAMTGCHWHPSLADDEVIADALIRAIDAGRADWR
ncbi:MAG TPA: GDSL-type esterase/lipase family protein [Steroidobacteraceae bacterium]|nr:GDSL-type esterase/lipase family protein [Steroidobacteraceae bacterium]